MALREILLPWDSQPQEVAQLSDRWAGRVVFAAVGDSIINLATGIPEPFSGVAAGNAGIGPAGLWIGGSGSFPRGLATRTQDFTVLAVAEPFSVSAFQMHLCCDSGSGAGRVLQFRTNSSSAEFIRFNTSVAAFTASAAGALTIGVPSTTVGVSRGLTIEVHSHSPVTGYRFGSATMTGTPQTYNDPGGTANEWWIRNRSNDASSCRYYLRAIISGPVSMAEAQELSANPWQLFAPRRIWVPQSASAGLPTITAMTPTSITSTTALQRFSRA